MSTFWGVFDNYLNHIQLPFGEIISQNSSLLEGSKALVKIKEDCKVGSSVKRWQLMLFAKWIFINFLKKDLWTTKAKMITMHWKPWNITLELVKAFNIQKENNICSAKSNCLHSISNPKNNRNFYCLRRWWHKIWFIYLDKYENYEHISCHHIFMLLSFQRFMFASVFIQALSLAFSLHNKKKTRNWIDNQSFKQILSFLAEGPLHSTLNFERLQKEKPNLRPGRNILCFLYLKLLK